METDGNPSMKFMDEIGEEAAVIIPVHLLQDLIVSALNGNVEMGTDLARPGEKGDEIRRKISGLNRAQSNPQGRLLVFHLFQKVSRERAGLRSRP